MRILTICPSKGRPRLLKDMLTSFLDTRSPSTDMLVAMDEDDPFEFEYMKILRELKIPCFTSLGLTVTEHINRCYSIVGDSYDYFHLTNDDVIYKTPNWDLEMVGRLSTYEGISYANDGFQSENLPTFPMISARIVRALGWLQLPTLKWLCGDLVWKDIGRALGRLHYLPDVHIEHRHWINGKRTQDNPDYDKVYKEDMEQYHRWWVLQRKIDIAKLREVLNAKQP